MGNISKPHGGMKGLKPCGAHAKGTGKPCRQPSMANGRCKFHGGKSTGRPITTGLHTKQAKEDRKLVNKLVRESKELLK